MTKRLSEAHTSRCVLAVASISIVLATLVPPPSEASAQFGADAADRRALQLYEEGEAAYTEGRYEAAVQAFTAAHRLSPRPLLLYNLANAYERLGRYSEAVDALAEYLPDAPIDERAVLQTRLENLRLRVAGGTPQPAAADPVAVTPEPAASGGGGSSLLVPGVILAAVGVASVGAGVVFGVFALDARGSLEGPDADCASTSDGRVLCLAGTEGAFADAEQFALLADILMIGGGAIAATGVILMIVSALGDDEPAAQASWMPQVEFGPSSASVGVRGRF